jgi:hypothetical protein
MSTLEIKLPSHVRTLDVSKLPGVEIKRPDPLVSTQSIGVSTEVPLVFETPRAGTVTTVSEGPKGVTGNTPSFSDGRALNVVGQNRKRFNPPWQRKPTTPVIVLTVPHNIRVVGK